MCILSLLSDLYCLSLRFFVDYFKFRNINLTESCSVLQPASSLLSNLGWLS